MFQFKKFRTRLLFFLVTLLGIVLGAVFFSVNQANISNARLHLEEALQITANTFAKSLKDREQILREKIRLLSGDFAFKTAFATHETETIKSALENHRQRVDANIMLLLTLDGKIIADTMPKDKGQPPLNLSNLLTLAKNNSYGEASAIQILNDIAYQMVVVPLFTPEPSAWILIGFVIDENFTREQREFTRSEISILYQSTNKPWQTISSTLPNAAKLQLNETITRAAPATNQVYDLVLQDEEYLTLALSVQTGKTGQGLAILQRSLDAALAPYLRLRALMLTLFGIGLALSIAGALLLSRGLSQPIEKLVKTARRIESGDYSKGVEIQRSDEIGTLANSFNSMVAGLAERDKVQSLLGKVVSREVADELLNKGIELGGEEREVTMLFSDIRDFTTLCEHRKPGEILNLLNRYLTHMSTSVEKYDGVVDKYIGDAIMALFGAPVSRADSPQKAVYCALDMLSNLKLLNVSLMNEGQKPLAIGIGINTDKVVAGNMGSANRLNYTVIGEGVNLAARIEGLTKHYGVKIIVSEATRKQCQDILFREIDLVQVKGSTKPVAIFEPLSVENSSADKKQALDQYHTALAHYRHHEWDKAEKIFKKLLASDHKRKIYKLYLERIDNYRKNPPLDDWEDITVFTYK